MLIYGFKLNRLGGLFKVGNFAELPGDHIFFLLRTGCCETYKITIGKAPAGAGDNKQEY
jgi:hypothetical protein